MKQKDTDYSKMPTRMELLHKRQQKAHQAKHQNLTKTQIAKKLGKYSKSLSHNYKKGLKYSKALASGGFDHFKKYNGKAQKHLSHLTSNTANLFSKASSQVSNSISKAKTSSGHKVPKFTIYSNGNYKDIISKIIDFALSISSIQAGGILLFIINALVVLDFLIHINSLSLILRILAMAMLLVSSAVDYYLVMTTLAQRKEIDKYKHQSHRKAKKQH